MAQKAIRTTLPDGRTALNNIIDKYTGESIQLVKIDALPGGVSADGIIYFETSTSEYGTEYWVRAQFETTRIINVRWFGVTGDGTTDCSDQVMQILDKVSPWGGEVFFPEGHYVLNKTVVFPQNSSSAVKNITISGNNNISNLGGVASVNSRGITLFEFKGVGGMFDLRLGTEADIVSSSTFQNFNAICTVSGSGTSTIGLNIATFTRGSIKNVSFTGFDYGVKTQGNIYYSIIDTVRCSQSNVAAMELSGLVNGTTIRNCAFNNSTVGLRLNNAGRSVGVEGCWIEHNQTGVVVSDTRQANLISCYFEHHSVTSVSVGYTTPATCVNLIGCSIAIDDGADNGVRAVVQGQNYINFIGCQFANRSENALTVVRSAGGTANATPRITSVGNSWFDGTPVDIATASWMNTELNYNGISIGRSTLTKGSGTPEGSVTAVDGSLFIRTGDIHGKLYVKRTASGNMGWERVGQVPSGPTASRPSGASSYPGIMYFDTTLNKPVWYDGSNWVDSTGATV